MNTPSDAMLAQAAELRASGASWEMVASQVERDAETVRRWPTRYADAWDQLYREAENHLVAEAGAEALHCLRRLLRSKDDRCCLAAAQHLRKERHAQRKEEDAPATRPGELSTDGQRIAKFLDGIKDEDLPQFLDEMLGALQLPQRPEASEPPAP